MKCKQISREEQLGDVWWCQVWSRAASGKCKVGETRADISLLLSSRVELGTDPRLSYPQKLRNCCHYMATPRAVCELEEGHKRKDVFEVSWMFSSILPSVFIHLETQFHQNWVQCLQGLPLLAQSRAETTSQ